MTSYGAMGGLYRDRRNTARETRARYRYQDECVALRVIRNLADDEIESVVVEWSTDYALRTASGDVELVSVKHAEPSQGPWTLSRLKAKAVLTDLHRVWQAMEQRYYVFESNAGIAPDIARLSSNEQLHVDNPLVARVAKHLRVTREEATSFLYVFTISPTPLPRRNEISDVAVQEMGAVLRQLGRDETNAKVCYEALVQRIASASTDEPLSASERVDRLCGLVRTVIDRREADELANQTLRMSDLCSLVRSTTGHVGGIDPGHLVELQTDPLFTGRTDELRQIEALLSPGDRGEVAPVSVHGLTGIGKSSLAMEFAARNKGVLSTSVIPAASREAILTGVADLIGSESGVLDAPNYALDLSDPHRLPQLPSDPNLLVVFDGVVDPRDLYGIVGRRSRTRVIITTTMTHVDVGYREIVLGGWADMEALDYVRRVLRGVAGRDAQLLADRLGGHPLAIAQAVHYCKTEHLSIPDYLDRLARYPLGTLDVGSAGGYRESVGRAISLALDSVRRQDAAATDLLRVLSYAASQPVSEATFSESDVVIPFLNMMPRPGMLRHLRTRLDGHFRGARRLIHQLREVQTRDRAIALLHRYSLVTRRSGHLILHPLVQLVVRSRIPAKSVPILLRASLGLFGNGVPNLRNGNKDVEPALSQSGLTHLMCVVDHARRAGYRPPIATAAMCEASDLYAEFGDPASSARFAEQGVELARQQESVPMLEHALAKKSRSYQLLSRTDEALEVIAEREYWAGISKDAIRLYQVFRDRLMVNLHAERYVAAEAAEHELVQYLEDSDVPYQIVVEIESCRARLAWANQRLEEAQTHIEKALDSASIANMAPTQIAELHNQASRIASSRGEFVAAREHQMAALEHAKSTSPEPTGRLVDQTVAYCSVLMDEGRFSGVEDMLNEALRHILDISGPGSLSHGAVLAELGRCLFAGSHNLRRAQDVLEEAEQILGDHGDVARSALSGICFHLAQIFCLRRRYTKASAYAHEAVDIDTAIFGEQSIEVGKDLLICAQIEASARRGPAARRTLRRCIEILQASPSHPGTWLDQALDLQRLLGDS